MSSGLPFSTTNENTDIRSFAFVGPRIRSRFIFDRLGNAYSVSSCSRVHNSLRPEDSRNLIAAASPTAPATFGEI